MSRLGAYTIWSILIPLNIEVMEGGLVGEEKWSKNIYVCWEREFRITALLVNKSGSTESERFPYELDEVFKITIC